MVSSWSLLRTRPLPLPLPLPLFNCVGPSLSSRSYGWNPFLKKVSLEQDVDDVDADADDVSIDRKEVVTKVKQELRRKNTGFDELHEWLFELVGTSPNKDSFILINEILRKLEQKQLKNHHSSKTLVDTQTPPLSTDDAYKVFKIVIDHIDTENFQSARFIPRLYLQLTQVASNSGNHRLLIQVFNDFVRYLSILGYEDQLIKVVQSFIKEHVYLVEDAMISVCEILQKRNPSPSLTLTLLKVFSIGNDDVSISMSGKKSKLHDLVLQSIEFFLANRNELYAIDQHNLSSIQDYIEESIGRAKTPEELYPLLKLCQDRSILQTQESSILTKTTFFLLNNNNYVCQDEIILKSFINSFIKNSSISYEENIIAGNIMIESFFKNHKESKKSLFDIQVQWDVFNDCILSGTTQDYLLKHKSFVDQDTFNLVITSMVFSNSNFNFQESLTEIFNFFESNFELEKTVEIYALILERGIRNNDSKQLEKTFEESLENGISWDSKPKQLCDFLYVLASQNDAEVGKVFTWYKKIKVFIQYLDSKSYNSLMKLFLKNTFIGDAITSLKKELPPLAKDTKYSVEQYPELFQSMYDWILKFNGNPEVSWTLYSELQKYFHLPFQYYHPLMEKFIQLKRPDASFMIFANLKKIHRTTGSIPPPTPEMYSYLFKSFGEELYDEGVEKLHMVMKLDLQLNTDIKVMNSILGAYCNLQDFFKTQELFDSILSMPIGKGLNNETITIMLKSFTYVSLPHVENFWDNLYEYNILPNEENFKQYLIAYCYHEEYDKALQLANDVDNYDLLITPEIIKSLYNWTQGEEKKKNVENWALKNHTLIWNTIKTEEKLKSINNGSTGDEKTLNDSIEGLTRETSLI